MKIAFFGTPSFAVGPLKSLIASGHTVEVVVSRPDRPKGRSMEKSPTPVKEAALAAGIPVLQPEKVSAPDFLAQYKNFRVDLNVVAAFGQIFPEELIYFPKFATINIHASLLPKYRGAAPINWAIINGERETGVTYQFIVKKLDAGDIIYSEKYGILPGDNSITLYEKLSKLSADTVVKVVDSIGAGKAAAIKQDEAAATFVRTLKKEDGKLDFTSAAPGIVNMVRGLLPWPCAFCFYNGKTLKIYEASEYGAGKSGARPGEIFEVVKNKGFVAAAGDGAVLIGAVQPESGKKMAAADFALGQKNIIGSFLK
ncbi:MAG: methionyl-tRNA formyltransferase [Candidatus Goldiibacteriota bacterium]|jgi:methionyl-tRNA formyltransferase